MEKIDYYLLAHKFLSGEISESENDRFQDWLHRQPEHKEIFDEIKLIWDNAGYTEVGTNYYNPDEALGLIQSKISQRSLSSPKGLGAFSNLKRPGLLKVAAAILLLLCLNLLAWYLTRPDVVQPLEIISKDHYSKVLLSDSSRVFLNKNSAFSYKGTPTKREVYLKGEAYFKVVRDQDRPFYVHLKNASIQVLGTSFNVKAYPESNQLTVVVTSGTVNFYTRAQSVSLDAGEKAVLEKPAQRITKTVNQDPNFDSWRTQNLQFKNTPLQVILQSLEEYYGARIQAKDKRILSCRFTGTFTKARLEEVLTALAFGLNLDYQYHDGQFILSGKGCNHTNN